MAVNPSSGRGSSPLSPSLPPSVFGPLVFVAFLANLDAMRLLGRLVYDTAVPGAVEGLQHRTSMLCKRGDAFTLQHILHHCRICWGKNPQF